MSVTGETTNTIQTAGTAIGTGSAWRGLGVLVAAAGAAKQSDCRAVKTRRRPWIRGTHKRRLA